MIFRVIPGKPFFEKSGFPGPLPQKLLNKKQDNVILNRTAQVHLIRVLV